MELKTTDMYFITLVLSFHQMLKVSSFSMQTTHLGSLIRTFQGIPYSRCKFECKAKRKCLGFIYRRHIGLCMLLDDSDMGFGDRDPKISFRAKRDWKQDSFDEVCEETCSDLETCNDNESTVSCTLEECGEPPLPIGNVTQFGNFRQIGSEILYMCHGKSGLTGREVTSRVRSECQTGGEWLHQSVTCLEENAILYNYKGCFLDKPERALNEYQFYNTTMTISLCALICYEREQKYFGLEHYKHCFCGSTLMYEVPVTNCNTPCLGDQSTMCGGGWALSVYKYLSEQTLPV